jgi:hypothetical protein
MPSDRQSAAAAAGNVAFEKIPFIHILLRFLAPFGKKDNAIV